MRKILLIIALTLCIFQMVVLATDITMGNPAIAGGNVIGAGGYTLVDKKTPANGTGTITTVEVWTRGASTTGIFATFFSANGNVLTAPDYQNVDAVAKDYKRFEVNLDLVEGDYIGFYYDGIYGELEVTSLGDSGIWWLIGDHTQGTDVTFSLLANSYASIKGTGSTEVEEEEINVIFFGTNF